MFKLVTAIWNDEETKLEIADRYFGSLIEIIDRCCHPYTENGFGVYQKQSDGSWLLYYQSL